MISIFSMIDGWLIANPIIVVIIDDGNSLRITGSSRPKRSKHSSR
jgi:hypothetical protein